LRITLRIKLGIKPRVKLGIKYASFFAPGRVYGEALGPSHTSALFDQRRLAE